MRIEAVISLVFLIAFQATAVTSAGQTADAKRDTKFNFSMGAAFLKAADKDGDGRLSLAEFEDAMMQEFKEAIASRSDVKAKMTDDKMAAARDKMFAPMFRSLDKNSDGQLTAEELHIKKPAN